MHALILHPQDLSGQKSDLEEFLAQMREKEAALEKSIAEAHAARANAELTVRASLSGSDMCLREHTLTWAAYQTREVLLMCSCSNAMMRRLQRLWPVLRICRASWRLCRQRTAYCR